MHTISHYKWLDLYFMAFIEALRATGVKLAAANEGLIVAHGDKCYGFRQLWAQAGVPFPHGVAIYLLSYCYPYTKEVRETDQGWVPPGAWVVEQYDKFKPYLPEIDESDVNIRGLQGYD